LKTSPRGAWREELGFPGWVVLEQIPIPWKDWGVRTRKAAKTKTLKKDAKRTLALPPRTRMRSQINQITALEQEARLLKLKTQGYTRAEIAADMGLDRSYINVLWERSFAEFIIDHRKLRDEKFAEMLAGHEAMIRSWVVLAETDEKAAAIVLRARREISRMCGHGNNAIIELSGVGGGPITTVNATPMEAARLVREAFGGKVLPFTGTTLNAKTG